MAETEKSALLQGLFQKYNRALRIYLKSAVSCEHTADELAQETFLRLARVDDSTEIEHPKAYLFRIAKNISTDFLRRKMLKVVDDRAEVEESTVVSSGPTPEEIASCNQTKEILDKALSELPLKTRQIFCMRRYDGLQILEIAERMQLTDRMVYNHLKDATTHLVACFREAE